MTLKVSPNWWKHLFDDIYLITDARSVCDDDITRKEVDMMCDLLSIRPEHKILDFCGGHGRHSFELCERGFTNCTLLDYSRFLIEKAKQTAVRKQYPIHCICSDARNASLPSGLFDRVCILGNSLGYQEDPRADAQILREAWRVLDSGGWFLVDVTNGSLVRNDFKPIAWHEAGDDIVVCRERQLMKDAVHAREMVLSKSEGLIRDATYSIRLYDAQALQSLIELAGFTDIRVHTGYSPRATQGDYGCMNFRMIAIGRKP